MEETKEDEDCLFKNKDMIREAESAKDKYFALKAKPKPKKEDKKKDKDDTKEDVSSDELWFVYINILS